MKIIFWGNSHFSLKPFQILIEQFSIKALVTAPNTFVGRGLKQLRLNPVKELALKYDIPVLQPQKLKNNLEFQKQLLDFNPDFHVIVSYGRLIPVELLELVDYKFINLHASLLPELRGPSPIQYALWQGSAFTGNTVQFLAEGMDEGDIIAQSRVAILPQDNYEILEEKLAKDGAELLSKVLRDINKKSYNRTPQDHQSSTYTKLIHKEDGAVYFSMSADDIYNAFRAFHQKPGIYLPLEMGNVKILDCEPVIWPQEEQGKILSIGRRGVLVATYENAILLKILQAPAKKSVSGFDFANGLRLKERMFLK
ncbi:methionyl-tRNA formyltransferase [Brevinema andersonii]|uniref:Methionyl-tRNA formyltransferase n=1 Tax=Brevinema andersonii TaxID=34097 RepID=A0A1I1D3T9_BREAD|nr:methionyl-tRNA formyltransferase [Brevinema andersonii]SFB68996.1 methionyl-tRNA formyltransferase [Brevinema andersonii]